MLGGVQQAVRSKPKKSETIKMRRWGKYRLKFWVHAVIVGALLTGQIHLYTAEVLHHHDEDTRTCKIEHRAGAYLHATPEISPLCPLCQVIRNGSVRPAVQSRIPKPDRKFVFQPLTCQARYLAGLALSLQARAPPLS